MTTLVGGMIYEVEKFIQPLLSVVNNPATIDRLLREIGAEPENAGGDTLVTALETVVTVALQLDTLVTEESASLADISRLLDAVRKMMKALKALSDSSAKAALEGFGHDLLELLIVAYLAHWHPVVREIVTLLTLIEPVEEQPLSPAVIGEGKILRMPYRIDRFHLDRISPLVHDPVATLRAYYWNSLQTEADADAIADKLFKRVRNLLRELGVSCRYGILPEDAPLFGEEAPLVDHALVVYCENQLAGGDVDAGISFTLSPAEHGDLGLVLAPFGVLTETGSLGLWKIEFKLAADVQAFAIGRNGPTILASASTVDVDAKITATLTAPASGPAFVYGSPTGSRLEIGGATASAELKLSETDQSGGISAGVSKAALVISAGDGDGFLKSVLPSKGLRADFDLGIAWSSAGGLSFSGSAGLDATLSVGVSLGGVLTIPTVHLGLKADDAGLAIETSASIGLSIGVIQALVDRLGLTTNITFPKDGGNLGVADVAFSFKLPSGVGLAIDSAGVSGGGVLAVGPAASEYSGMLQLQFDDLSLQAFGLITTQVAGGSGYSLLAMIDANFPPVQLGWGFTLNGAGGLLAVHRTADTDKLRAALKADKLSTILFPKTTISNAPLVLAQLDALFPTAEGRFLFGPMALIGWGTPTLLTVALAVILELPEPIRILLLARLAVRLPSATAPVVKINMDALGVLDLSQGQFALDATLYDSKIAGFTLSGDMALRANWGTQREFLLAIGGFHPQFTPPAGFPSLQRVTIDMSAGSISKLRLAAYLAITSNTLQFGADLDVLIGVSGFGLSGHLAFDAMLQYVPLHFDADISASIALMAGGDTLMSVGLDATLSGPGPWHIAGKFKIHFFFFDLHLSFSATWGDDAPSVPLVPVDVLSLLTAAFADSRNWGTLLPETVPALVSLRSADGTTVVAHPMALLEVHERIVPLDLQITRFGASPVASGASTFTITSFTVGTWSGAGTKVMDDFAPAQFFDLTDQEKLAGPSFEQHDAGVRIDSLPAKSAPQPLVKTITYETWYVDTAGGLPREDTGQKQTVTLPGNWRGILQFGASGKAAIWNTGDRRYKTRGAGLQVVVKPMTFAVASTSTLASAGVVPASGVTYSAAKAVLAKTVREQAGNGDTLQVVALHEMVVS